MGKGRGSILADFAGNLSEVFRIREKIRGKVDLQKTVYFMMRLGVQVPFSYRWNVLGPYSYDLAHYSDHLVVEGLLKYARVYSLNEKAAKSYNANLTPQMRARIEAFFSQVEETCRNNGYDIVYFLECAASLDFIQMNLRDKRNVKEKSFRLLSTLKPRRAELFRNCREDAWNLLTAEGLLQ
jgi:hypothetical protein